MWGRQGFTSCGVCAIRPHRRLLATVIALYEGPDVQFRIPNFLATGRAIAMARRGCFSNAVRLVNGQERKTGAIRYAVDFVGPLLKTLKEMPQPVLSASAGKVSTPVVLQNPGTGGIRVDFFADAR